MENYVNKNAEVTSLNNASKSNKIMKSFKVIDVKNDGRTLDCEITSSLSKDQLNKFRSFNTSAESLTEIENINCSPHLIHFACENFNKHKDNIPNREKGFTESNLHFSAVVENIGKFEQDAYFNIDESSNINISKKENGSTEEKKIANLRKNIRDVMGESQLDTNTLAAQKEESDRLARVAEQQKVIREYQRQTAVNKHNVRTQNRVLSLLQSGTAFAKEKDIKDDRSLTISSEQPHEVIFSDLTVKKDLNDCCTLTEKDNKTNIPDVKNSIEVSSVNGPANDIVTIEDSSSEDDCILLSDVDDEDLEQDLEDDPSNSGLHVKDVYNVPDENGCVVVNVGHPEDEEDIFLAPQIAKIIKPHQIGGVRFLFDNIIESTKRFNSSTGFGCILAHSMGLGKTLQVVCFCDIFLRHTDSKTVLCVMPINTLQNWVSEFDMWIPQKSTDTENVRSRTFNVFVLNDQQKTLTAREKIILKWSSEGGVLLMGYELFRLLALKLIPNRKRKVGKASTFTEKVETEAHKRITERIYQALVKPGPDLVICDEGHRIKNAHAGISLALKQIRTRRRIVLTGYPLQNNLLEYWCMVDFVRPNYLGTRTEFCNMFERPIQNGQCIDSTPEDIKLMRYRAHVLHSLLVGFVQRRSHVVLQHTLPQKLEYVILTKMNDFQRKLYDTFMNDVVRKKSVPNPLKAFAVCCKIWNHPDVLYNFLKKRETDLDLEIDDTDGAVDSLKIKTNKANNFGSSKSFTYQSKVEKTFDHSVNEKTASKIYDQAAYSDFGKVENLNKTLTRDYNQSSLTDMLIAESNEDSYWHDTNSHYYGYHSLCGNVSSPQKPDYVGMVVKENHSFPNLNVSSQLVDLDTKEIKTVKTDIDLPTNKIVNNVSLLDRKQTIPQTKEKTEELSREESSFRNTQLNALVIRSLNNSKTIGALTSEKGYVKGKNDELNYDWAIDIMKGYEPNLLRNSPKMEIFFCILNESIKESDRVLLFSQSLLTLNLIEKFLQSTLVPDSNNFWKKNISYFRLDGSTASQEREKLVNDFNSNANVLLFLISTKAGSLGINLVGANRVIVFDASWNPCHDTQAVYRIYRYGQQKQCFVYRIVMDKCLEKKIYDRQVKKQGMSDRVVDECNPDAHLSLKDVTNLCYDYDNENSPTEFQKPLNSFTDTIIRRIIERNKSALSKEPFHHESLLIDRKEKKLSLAEKRQAQRGYELEKKAATKHLISCQTNKLQYRIVRNDGTIVTRPVASVRPMQTYKNGLKSNSIRSTRWIPAEVWQRQGMTAQEMTLPLDVVIPTNSSEKSNIILKSGQRVMVLKSSKGIYMQLESGKIIAIRTSNKIKDDDTSSDSIKRAKPTDVSQEKSENKSLDNFFKNNSASQDCYRNTSAELENRKKTSNNDLIVKSSDITKFNQQNCSYISENLTTKQSNYCHGLNNKISAMERKIENTKIHENSVSNKESNIKAFPRRSSKSVEIEDRNKSEKMPAYSEYRPTHLKKTSQTDFAFCTMGINNHQKNEKYDCHSTADSSINNDVDTKLPCTEKSLNLSQHQYLHHNYPQQHYHEQKDSYVSVHNGELSHYVDKVQLMTSQATGNAISTNFESTPRQYSDTIYENSLTRYDYQHGYSMHNSTSSISSYPQQHNSSHYHSYSNIQANSMTSHPFYIQWPPMSTLNQPNQHNINPSYTKDGSSSNQWQN